MRNIKNMLVTGGLGFIGANFIRFALKDEKFQGKVVNIDKITYAGSTHNISDIEQEYKKSYIFCRSDIRNTAIVEKMIRKYDINFRPPDMPFIN